MLLSVFIKGYLLNVEKIDSGDSVASSKFKLIYKNDHNGYDFEFFDLDFNQVMIKALAYLADISECLLETDSNCEVEQNFSSSLFLSAASLYSFYNSKALRLGSTLLDTDYKLMTENSKIKNIE